jgi:hypothetical protein
MDILIKIVKKTIIFFLPLLIYAVLSAVFFGGHAITNLENLKTYCVRITADSTSHIWFLNWWTFAIQHKLNLFLTDYVWAPSIFNLAHATTTPGIALLMLPITLTLGPVATFNITAIFASAISAWTAYLLCYHITKSFPASLCGGYFFGFSAYEISSTFYGNINLNTVFLIPVILYLSLLYLNKKIRGDLFIIFLSLCLIFQFLVSIEILATMVLFGTFLWFLAFKIYPEKRSLLCKLGYHTIISLFITLIFTSPFLYYFFKTPSPTNFLNPLIYTNDFNNFYIPPLFIFLQNKFLLNYINPLGTSYLGFPLIVIISLFCKQYWKFSEAKIIIIFLLTAFITSLGFEIQIAGYDTYIPLPGLLLNKIPIIKYAIFHRFSLYGFLAVAILVAIWLKEKKHSLIKYLLVALAIFFILPITNKNNFWAAKIPKNIFFSSQEYKKFIQPNDIVLPLPFGSWNSALLWQQEANMYFRIVGGYTSAFVPPEFDKLPIVQTLLFKTPLTKDTPEQLQTFIATHNIKMILETKNVDYYWGPILKKIGYQPTKYDWLYAYTLPKK